MSTTRTAHLPRLGLDALRGALIGLAEIVPGVSGGTIALIVGVYETLIEGAGHLARGAARLVGDGLRGRGTAAAVAHFRAVQWSVVLPIGIGMLTAIAVGAAVLAPLLESYPTGTRAVFVGLIVASLIIPARMVGGRWKAHEIVIGLLAAVLTFVLSGLPQAAAQEPALWVVAIAAAFAVCALVLPGVSGSYLLLTVGMYAPTLAAVNDRNFAYLGTFALGAILGLGLFVSGLQWLLDHRHRLTLVVMTGLMLGSLRALWPWQDEKGAALAPGSDWGFALLLVALGAAIVATLIAVEASFLRGRERAAELAAAESATAADTHAGAHAEAPAEAE